MKISFAHYFFVKILKLLYFIFINQSIFALISLLKFYIINLQKRVNSADAQSYCFETRKENRQ